MDTVSSLHVLCPPKQVAPKFMNFTNLAILKLDCTPEHLFQIMPFPMNLSELEINLKMPRGVKTQYFQEVFNINLSKLENLKSLVIRKSFWGLPFDLNLLNLHKEVEIIKLINIELQNIKEVISQAKHVRHLQISSKMKCYTNLLAHLYPGKENEKFIHNKLPHLNVLKFKCFHGTLKNQIELPSSLAQLQVTLVQQQQSKAGQFSYKFNFNQSKKIKALSFSDQSRNPHIHALIHLVHTPVSLKDLNLKNVKIEGLGTLINKQEKLKNLELEDVNKDINLGQLPPSLRTLSIIAKRPFQLKPIIKGANKLQSLSLHLKIGEPYLVIKSLPKLKYLELKSLGQSTLLVDLPSLQKLKIKQSFLQFKNGVISELEIINQSCCLGLKGIDHFVKNDLVERLVFDSTLCAISDSIMKPLQESNQNLKVINVQFKGPNLADFVYLIDRNVTNLEQLQITRIPKIGKMKALCLTNQSLRVLKIQAFVTCFGELPLTVTEYCTRLQSVSLTASLVALNLQSNLMNLEIKTHVLNLCIGPPIKVKNLKLALESVHDNPFLKSRKEYIHEAGFNFMTQVERAELNLSINEPIEFAQKYLKLTQLRFALSYPESPHQLEQLTGACPNLEEVELHSLLAVQDSVTVLGESIRQIDLFEAKGVEKVRVRSKKEIKIKHTNPSLKLEYIK